MSLATTIPHPFSRNVRVGSRTQRATWMLGGLLFIFLFTPTFKVLPIRSEALNRPLHDLLDLFVVGIWIVFAILRWPRGIIRPQWLALCLWLLPLSYIISIIMYGLIYLDIDIKQFYILLFSMRPLALTGLVILICQWGKLSLTSCNRVLQIIVWTLALSVVYVTVLAFLQIRQITAAQQFIHDFYRYDLANPEVVYFAVTQYGRASSIFHWPNSLSIYLVISVFLLVTYAGKSGRCIWLWIPIMIGVGGVVLAGSRAGLTMLVLGIVFIAFSRRQYRLLLLLALGAILFGTVISFVEVETDRVSRLYELFDWLRGVGPMPLTFALRIYNWIDAVAYYATQPTALTGITIIGTRVGRLTVDSFDSEYLMYFVWNGAIGLFCFLLFQLGLIIYNTRLPRWQRNINTVKTLSQFLLTGALILPVVAVSQEVWSQQRMLHLYFICLGLLIYSRNLTKAERALQWQNQPDLEQATDGTATGVDLPIEGALDRGVP